MVQSLNDQFFQGCSERLHRLIEVTLAVKLDPSLLFKRLGRLLGKDRETRSNYQQEKTGEQNCCNVRLAHKNAPRKSVRSPAFRREWSNVIHSVACQSCRLKAGLQTLFQAINDKRLTQWLLREPLRQKPNDQSDE